MKRSTKVKWGEIKVGLLILAAIVVLLWASFSGGGTSIFDKKMVYKTYFDNVNGLVKGAPVWISGVEVGNIISVEIVNLDSANQIEVNLRVIKSVQNMITEDARIKIGTIGFIGDKYVEIIPGSFKKPMLEAGSIIPSISPGDIASMFKEGEKAMVNAQGVAANLEEITDKIKKGEGTAGQLFTNDKLYHEMTKMLAALTILINEMQVSQKKIVSSIDDISGNLGSISDKINSNDGTVGKFISDPGLYDNLHASTGKVDSILDKINRGDGTAGAMVNDDELYQEIKNLIVRVENLVSDIEQNPRKYFKFSVF
ncbi:MAG: MlaD family protein [Candidatus Zixiibacteriota bacterium]